MKKIGFVSLGCPKNLVDTEVMLGLVTAQDYEITNEEDRAEVIIVNTCGFIESARQESINTILEMAKYKEAGKCRLLIVSGCLAERYREDILKEIPEVDAVIGTGNFREIVYVIERAFKGERFALYGRLAEMDDDEMDRINTSSPHTAYLKIAEGCDNCCTYCIIPSLRGKYRSRKMDTLLKDTEKLAENGVKELILVAQDTTRYGLDLYGKRKLHELLSGLEKIDGIEWIRILYCYPEEITDELIEAIAKSKKICRYIDIPLQHASDRILKLMGRRGDSRLIRETLSGLRKKIPGITIRTTFIAGFPGESEEDFRQLYDFVEEMKFDRLGVFTYSREEDTPAFSFENQVDDEVKLDRQKRLMELQKKISVEKNRLKMGKIYRTIVEGVSEDGIFYYGRTWEDAPDIDGKIYFTSIEPLEIGSFVDVKALDYDDYDITGVVVL